MAEPLIELQDVSLCYRLAKQRIPSFKDYALHWIRGALRYEALWALRNVTLSILPGDAVGIVGRNGAGKSSLLKILSRVLKPTQGTARVRGTVAPILELGTGFDWELTGRENIYLNALLQGHTRREIDSKYHEIVEFSGLGDFIQAPIRNYSSGMVARLGFSIVTAWTPSVLVLDEFLAVGDAQFIQRCASRIGELRARGATLVLVSHSPEDIVRHCPRTIWLDEGRVAADGPSSDVIAAYLNTHVDAIRTAEPEAGGD